MNAILLIASVVNCYVGCHPGSADKQALHVLACDTESGAAKIVQSVNGPVGTTYFQLSPDGRFLYSAVAAEKDGQKRSAAVRFPILADKRLGAMEKLADLPCETPCHVSLSPDGARWFGAAYLSATAVSMAIDGSDLKSYVFPDDDMGPNKSRQRKSYAHFTFMTPDAKSLGVIDLGCDRIRFFDPVTLAVRPALDIKLDRGDGPRHAAWSQDGKRLYVLNELSSTLTAFSVSLPPQSNNQTIQTIKQSPFTRLGKWSMLPAERDRREADGSSAGTKAAAIKFTADGKILMASNRGHDSIAFFAVDEKKGLLTLKNIAKLSGSFPRDFELMPGEKFMVVGHKMSDEIRIYRFDRTACALTPVGDPIPCYHPLCFKFAN